MNRHARNYWFTALLLGFALTAFLKATPHERPAERVSIAEPISTAKRVHRESDPDVRRETNREYMRELRKPKETG